MTADGSGRNAKPGTGPGATYLRCTDATASDREEGEDGEDDTNSERREAAAAAAAAPAKATDAGPALLVLAIAVVADLILPVPPRALLRPSAASPVPAAPPLHPPTSCRIRHLDIAEATSPGLHSTAQEGNYARLAGRCGPVASRASEGPLGAFQRLGREEPSLRCTFVARRRWSFSNRSAAGAGRSVAGRFRWGKRPRVRRVMPFEAEVDRSKGLRGGINCSMSRFRLLHA